MLGPTLRRFNVICHSYCLMTNHFHLLLEIPDGSLSKADQFDSVYTRAFNRRHGRVGHRGGAEVINTNMYDKGSICRYRNFSCNDIYAISFSLEKGSENGKIQDSRSDPPPCAVHGTVRTVVWEDGGGDPASYPILVKEQRAFGEASSESPCP